jgi:hypothetical protein
MTNNAEPTCYVVGNTRSGKKILCATRVLELGEFVQTVWVQFSGEELFDAYCAYQYLAARSLRNHPSSGEFDLFEAHSRAIWHGLLDENQAEVEKSKIGIRNIFDIIRHGSSLVTFEFKNF